MSLVRKLGKTSEAVRTAEGQAMRRSAGEVDPQYQQARTLAVNR